MGASFYMIMYNYVILIHAKPCRFWLLAYKLQHQEAEEKLGMTILIVVRFFCALWVTRGSRRIYETLVRQG